MWLGKKDSVLENRTRVSHRRGRGRPTRFTVFETERDPTSGFSVYFPEDGNGDGSRGRDDRKFNLSLVFRTLVGIRCHGSSPHGSTLDIGREFTLSSGV